MADNPKTLAAMDLMARETRWELGAVPHVLGGIALEPGYHMIADDQFLMRWVSGYGFHYAPGTGITIERPVGGDPAEEALWLNGTTSAAVACLNGLYPLHASAVAHRGAVAARCRSSVRHIWPCGAGEQTGNHHLSPTSAGRGCPSGPARETSCPPRAVG